MAGSNLDFKSNLIEETLRKNVGGTENIFVFPTQIAATMWADWVIQNTDTKAVALERFIAWDDFKGTSVRSTVQDKRSIPGVMRELFAEQLLNENAEKPFLSYLVSREYAKKSVSFAPWISRTLPSLSIWEKRFGEKRISGTISEDAEDKDYMEIFTRYKKFLDANGLFDPAWETPPFKADGNRYFIFFPEILMDYMEYREILESSKDIEIIHLPEKNERKPLCNFFTNSRTELRYVALKIRQLHEEENIPWEGIAINVPNMDTYGPYLSRELELYDIPHTEKNGMPLSSSGAGVLFERIRQCVTDNFSYSSIKQLLMNRELPWHDEKLNERFIEFGRDNNCICSFESENKKFDVWEESFKKPLDKTPVDEKIVNMYRAMRKIFTAMVRAKSFAEIRTHYFTMRDHFFDMERCTEMSDLILSRCISELSALIEMEEQFPECKIKNYYRFFTRLLDDKMYVPQSESRGVQILPYRLAAAVPFDAQIIVDSSQASLSVTYKQLGFLSDRKRESLGFTSDPNVTPLFIQLYAMSAGKKILFTSSEKVFGNYALTNGELFEVDLRKEKSPQPVDEKQIYMPEKNVLLDGAELDKRDPYLHERKSFLDSGSLFPKITTTVENNGIKSWNVMQGKSGDTSESSKKKIASMIDDSLLKDGKVRITYSHLRHFYEDSHQFFNDYVLQIKDQSNEAQLMDPFAWGNLYHKILERYCMKLSEKDLPLAVGEDGLSESYMKILSESIDEGLEEFESSILAKEMLRTGKTALFETMINTVESFSIKYEGFHIYAVEKWFSYEPENERYYFYGKIDCLLSEPGTGECVLVDFKTSDNAIHSDKFFISDDQPVPDFQMPVYTYILKNQEKPIEIENCAFFNVKKGENKAVFGSIAGAREDVDFGPTAERFLELAKFYAEKVLAHDVDCGDAFEEFRRKYVREN